MNPRLRRWLARLICLAFFPLLIEGAAQLVYRAYRHQWYYRSREIYAHGLFQPHPYFAVTMTPNASELRNGVHIEHNSFRMRGPEFARPKPSGTLRIIACGGSTTYGTGVSDDGTWEHYLQRDLGAPWEVLNDGAPSGTSLEALLHTNLLFSEVQPDIALYYMGWNDARVQHVKALWPDYSDYHGTSVMGFALNGRDYSQRLASGYLLRRLGFLVFYPSVDYELVNRQTQGEPDKLTDHIDQRAIDLFSRNMHFIATLCHKQGVVPIFIPQVMNYDALTSDQPYGFLPFVRDRDMKTYMAAYGRALRKVAEEEGVGFMSEMLDEKFSSADFIDQGHFTYAGNEHFAQVVGDYLKKHPLAHAP
jgi:hypothetical protein